MFDDVVEIGLGDVGEKLQYRFSDSGPLVAVPELVEPSLKIDIVLEESARASRIEAKLLATFVNNILREMVADPMNMMGNLARVQVGFAFRIGLQQLVADSRKSS
jgi:hypothetical protein